LRERPLSISASSLTGTIDAAARIEAYELDRERFRDEEARGGFGCDGAAGSVSAALLLNGRFLLEDFFSEDSFDLELDDDFLLVESLDDVVLSPVVALSPFVLLFFFFFLVFLPFLCFPDESLTS
jgi:hypothetical protein